MDGCIYAWMYVFITYTCAFMYIYIERERERESEREILPPHTYTHMYESCWALCAISCVLRRYLAQA